MLTSLNLIGFLTASRDLHSTIAIAVIPFVELYNSTLKINIEYMLNMKNYKQILEAVNRGIQLALDDFDEDEV